MIIFLTLIIKLFSTPEENALAEIMRSAYKFLDVEYYDRIATVNALEELLKKEKEKKKIAFCKAGINALTDVSKKTYEFLVEASLVFHENSESLKRLFKNLPPSLLKISLKGSKQDSLFFFPESLKSNYKSIFNTKKEEVKKLANALYAIENFLEDRASRAEKTRALQLTIDLEKWKNNSKAQRILPFLIQLLKNEITINELFELEDFKDFFPKLEKSAHEKLTNIISENFTKDYMEILLNLRKTQKHQDKLAMVNCFLNYHLAIDSYSSNMQFVWHQIEVLKKMQKEHSENKSFQAFCSVAIPALQNCSQENFLNLLKFSKSVQYTPYHLCPYLTDCLSDNCQKQYWQELKIFDQIINAEKDYYEKLQNKSSYLIEDAKRKSMHWVGNFVNRETYQTIFCLKEIAQDFHFEQSNLVKAFCLTAIDALEKNNFDELINFVAPFFWQKKDEREEKKQFVICENFEQTFELLKEKVNQTIFDIIIKDAAKEAIEETFKYFKLNLNDEPAEEIERTIKSLTTKNEIKELRKNAKISNKREEKELQETLKNKFKEPLTIKLKKQIEQEAENLLTTLAQNANNPEEFLEHPEAKELINNANERKHREIGVIIIAKLTLFLAIFEIFEIIKKEIKKELGEGEEMPEETAETVKIDNQSFGMLKSALYTFIEEESYSKTKQNMGKFIATLNLENEEEKNEALNSESEKQAKAIAKPIIESLYPAITKEAKKVAIICGIAEDKKVGIMALFATEALFPAIGQMMRQKKQSKTEARPQKQLGFFGKIVNLVKFW